MATNSRNLNLRLAHNAAAGFLRSEPKLKAWHLVFVALVAFAVLFVRRPSVLLNAQFWAEDGTLWFAQAYQLSWWKPFLLTDAGYLQTVSRLVALASQALPMLYAPLLFNLAAIAVRVAAVTFLFSSRCRRIVPGFGAKLVVALAYLALPNVVETYANLTNSHWHLALLAFLVVMAEPARTAVGRTADFLLLLLFSVSGPFVLLLLPLALLRAVIWPGWRRGDALLALGVMSAGALVQILFLFGTGGIGDRATVPTLEPLLLLQLLGAKLVIAPLIGVRAYTELDLTLLRAEGWRAVLYALSAAVGIAVAVRASLRHRPLALFVVFSFLIFAASAIMPVQRDTLGLHYWEYLLFGGVGNRYFTLPSLAVVLCVLHLAFARPFSRFRAAVLALVVVLVCGTVGMWILKPWPDLRYPEHVARCEATEPGGTCVIPVLPQQWDLVILEKK